MSSTSQGAPGTVPLHWGGSEPRAESNSEVPLELPLNATLPESIESMVARMVHTHVMEKEQQEEPPETFEESNDFTPDEDEGLPDITGYTLVEVEPEALQGYEVSETTPEADSSSISAPPASQEASHPPTDPPDTPESGGEAG